MTLIGASAALRTLAESGGILDLRAPPEDIPILNIYGAMELSRLCIWAREGDVNGDTNAGAVYLLRCGAWLDSAADIDLAEFGTVAAGQLARIRPRPGSANFHLGATLTVADLDGNGTAEVLAAAALNRMGAALSPLGLPGKGAGGTEDGTLFIAWDDNFSGDWMPAPDFVIDAGPGSYTAIDGGETNEAFSEELLGRLDFDNDGSPDLFVGDLVADGWGVVSRNSVGLAHVIYDAGSLNGPEFDLEPDVLDEPGPPAGFAMAAGHIPVRRRCADPRNPGGEDRRHALLHRRRR